MDFSYSMRVHSLSGSDIPSAITKMMNGHFCSRGMF